MDQEKPDSNVLEIAEAQDYPVQPAKRSYAMLGVGLSCMLVGAAAVVAIRIKMRASLIVAPPPLHGTRFRSSAGARARPGWGPTG